MIIAIDEFPYLVRASSALPSVLQEYWDEKLSETKLLLIICGSSVSMMEGLLGYRSPTAGGPPSSGSGPSASPACAASFRGTPRRIL